MYRSPSSPLIESARPQPPRQPCLRRSSTSPWYTVNAVPHFPRFRSRGRTMHCKAMRLVLVVLLTASFGCTGYLRDGSVRLGQDHPVEIPPPEKVERPRERTIDPVELKWSGDPRIAFNA